jgi:hypothetical protein
VPLQLVTVCGGDGETLVVGSGTLLIAFRVEDMAEIARYDTGFPVLMLSVCPVDPSVFAAGSLHSVSIFSVSDSEIALSSVIELMLDSLGDHIFVNTIEWVPYSLLHLAIVCNAFVKVYDVPTDCFSPCLCLTPDGDEYFTSAVFTVKDEDPIGLFATSHGRIAVQPLGASAPNGPLGISLYLEGHFPPGSTISACGSSDLLFVTSHGAPMQIIHLSAAAAIGGVPSWIIPLPLEEPWFFVAVDGPVHFFIHPATGALLTLEFTDSGVEVARLSPQSSRSNGIPLLQGTCIHLTAFSLGGSVFAISGSTGQLLSMTAADPDDIPPPTDSRPYDAPNRLWTLSRVSTKAIEVLGSGDCNHGVVLNHLRLVIADSGASLRFRSTDQQQLIVGFRVFFRTRRRYSPPEWLKVNGRNVAIAKSGQAVCMASLRPEEVRPLRSHTLDFGGAVRRRRVCVDGIDVFVIDATALPGAQDSHDDLGWSEDGAGVFDFADAALVTRRGLTGVFDQLAMILPVAGNDVDAEMIDWFVRKVYTSPEFAGPARTILVKACNGTPEEAAAWGAALKSVVAAGEVHETLWPIVWRDLACLPECVRSSVATEVWAAERDYKGSFAVVAAFLTG